MTPNKTKHEVSPHHENNKSMVLDYGCSLRITKTCLFKYNENFTTKKWKFSDKNSDIFHISAQNVDCGYSLEPPRRGGSNEYHNLYMFF